MRSFGVIVTPCPESFHYHYNRARIHIFDLAQLWPNPLIHTYIQYIKMWGTLLTPSIPSNWQPSDFDNMVCYHLYIGLFKRMYSWSIHVWYTQTCSAHCIESIPSFNRYMYNYYRLLWQKGHFIYQYLLINRFNTPYYHNIKVILFIIGQLFHLEFFSSYTIIFINTEAFTLFHFFFFFEEIYKLLSLKCN